MFHTGQTKGLESRQGSEGSWVRITRVLIRPDMAESFFHFSHRPKSSQESHEIDPGPIG